MQPSNLTRTFKLRQIMMHLDLVRRLFNESQVYNYEIGKQIDNLVDYSRSSIDLIERGNDVHRINGYSKGFRKNS